MRNILLFLCSIVLTFSVHAQAALLGDWYTVDDKTGEKLSIMQL